MRNLCTIYGVVTLLLKVCLCTQTLLFSTRKEIRVAHITKTKKLYTVVKDLNDAVAVDYYYNGSLICWTDQSLEEIDCTTYNGTHTSGKTTVAKYGVTTPDGLACDWLTKKLYWTDRDTNQIEVVSLETKIRNVLVWQELDNPRGIALDPLEGLLFWTDWGESPKIERASMDGDLNTRKILASDNLFWPNSISLDIKSRKLYSLDGKLNVIEVMDYDGRDRKVLVEKGIVYPFALAVGNDKFFWSDWKTYSIHSIERKNGANPQELFHFSDSPMDIEILDASHQPYKRTACENNNGGCSHLCLLSSLYEYSCACPTGVRLLNKTQCAGEIENFLLVVQKNEISRVSLDTNYRRNTVIPLKGIKNAIGIDYDLVDNHFYWTDDELKSIKRSSVSDGKTEIVVADDLFSPDGIAVDWLARNLYWSDMVGKRIDVLRLNTQFRKTLIVDDVGEPRAVAVAPQQGWLFWSDWNEKKPKIERSDLDGSNRMVIVKEQIGWPNGIALDLDKNKLYWGDAKTDRIEVMNMDGEDRKVLVSDNLPHIYGLSLLNDHVYWTDWQRRALDSVNKYTGEDRTVILDQLPNVMGVKGVNKRSDIGRNPCSNNNGDCQQFCFSKPNKFHICSCQIEFELSSDNKTCATPDAYILAYNSNRIRRVSIQGSQNNDAIPIAGVKSLSAIDIDVEDKRLYWADDKIRSISRSFVNGSQPERLLELGLQSPESLAVDWLSSNLYWADTGTRKIEVCRLNGEHRKTLFWGDLKEPRNLVIDPREGYMFWTEWDGKGSIMKASMDGTMKQSLVSNIIRVNGLAVDFSEKMLYFTQEDNGVGMLNSYNFESGTRQNIHRYTNIKPYSVTHYSEYIYMSNWNDGSILRAGKYNGNQTIIYQGEKIVDLKIVHSSRQTGWNGCVRGNGGCLYLCLVRPASIAHTTVHFCTCPTHFTMVNEECRGPENFLLFAQRNTLHRLIVSDNDSPDMALSSPSLKPIRAMQYDPIDKFVYWIDSKMAAIRRSYENGSYNSVIVNSNDQYNNFYDLAIDPYNRLLYWSCSATDAINVTRLNNSSVGIVFKGENGEKPRNIVLYSEVGLLFWTDVGAKIGIVKARLDGQNKFFIGTDAPVDSISIDRKRNTLFYSTDEKIFSCGLDGKNKRLLVESGIRKIVGLTAIDSYLYWTDKERQHIERIGMFSDKRKIIVDQIPFIGPIVTVLTPSNNSLLQHPCSAQNHHGNCSHICINSTGETSNVAECSCPVGLKLNEDGRTCSILSACGDRSFTCASSVGECVPLLWKCDGQVDCPDGSDEVGCSECKLNQFPCHSGKCIDMTAVCDGYRNCSDGSDEQGCCSDELIRVGARYFRCKSDSKCIGIELTCDGWEQCADGSDESSTLCEGKHLPKTGGYAEESSNLLVAFALILIALFLVVSGSVVFCFKKQKRPLPDTEIAAMRPLAPTANGYADPGGRMMHRATPSSSASYERANVTGASSATSMVGLYPLNPPPSPATTILREEHCCTRLYSPPYPTPCSTDVCDESDTTYRTDSEMYAPYRSGDDSSVSYYSGYNKRNRRHPRHRHENFRADIDPCPPPPNSSDPPSPSSSTYFQPVVPPPSPTNR